MKTLLSYFTLLLFLVSSVQAQTTITIGTGTTTSGFNSLIATSTTTNKYSKAIAVYTAAEILAAGGTAGTITKLRWSKQGTGEYTTADATMNVFIKAVPFTTHAATPVTWATEVTGATAVYATTTQSFTTGTGWKEITLSTPFIWNGTDNLEIFVDWYRPSSLTASMDWEYTTTTNANAITYNSTGVTTSTRNNLRPNIQLVFAPTSGTDAGITSVTSPTSPVQPGVSLPIQATLRNFGSNPITSATIGFSVNGTVISNNYSWTGNLASTQTSAPITIGNHTFATGNNNICVWAKTTGDTNASNDSTCVTVIACQPLTGTYTINKNAPTSATNYQSISAAVQAMTNCGISSAVTFNVVSGTGPYNEQVTIPAISGASATNTITFNGNSNKISFASTTANRAVVRLDGADYVTFNNFQIEASDLTYGWGVHLLNGADNNTISNNTIAIASTSTTEANSVGIVFSNSTTAITTGGNTGNNNIISGNTITGGFKGIHLQHVITTVSNNQLKNNTITDFYSMGIEVAAANTTLVENNNISRPTRATTGAFYGVYLTTGSFSTTVSKNRIHNTKGTDPTPTGAVYAIYITGSDAAVGSENIVKNNLIYNVDNTGTIYAIYNNGSAGAHYYHNTLSLENIGNTGAVRGFYQTVAAVNIKFVNNIIAIAAGTSGVKTGLYFGTTTSTITSNNNVIYVVNGNIGFYSAAQATLADWKAVNNAAFDQNSVSADPQFSSPATGNFTPTNVAVNNIGQAAPTVPTDINGLTRNPNSPDPGAYEFLNNPTDLGITAITSPNSVCGLTAQETITVVITNFGTNPQSNIPVSYTVNGGSPVTAVFAGPLAPGTIATYTFITPANLSTAGAYTIVAQTNLTGDNVANNNSTTKVVTNALFPNLPISLNFETASTGVNAMKTVTRSNSTIIQDAGASNGTASTQGMIMAGVTNALWTTPTGQTDPWLNNLNNFSAAYICFNPAGGSASDSLWLTFDLKQLFKTANANTNFRVTVNGAQVGPTYNPPFSGTPIVWNTIKVDLTTYKTLPTIELGFESSVKEEYANGAGMANLIDNVMIKRRLISGVKADVLATKLSVYPNPSNGNFNVSLQNGKAYNLEVTDLAGKVILKQQAKGDTQLKLENTAKGIYLLKVTSEGNTTTRKLIVE